MGTKIVIFLVVIFLFGCKSLSGDMKINKMGDSYKELDSSSKEREISIGEIEESDVLYESEEYEYAVGGSGIGYDGVSITPTPIIDRKVESEISMGQVIYKVPDTMIVMKNYQIIVRISRSKSINMTEDLIGDITKKEIKTTSKMEVSLVDPSPDKKSFNILPINSPNQMVDSLEYTEWTFQVSPIKPGTNQLNLIISIVKDGNIKQIVFKDEIFVKSNPKAQIGRWWEINWEWSIEKLIIPVLVYLFGIWTKHMIEKRKNKRK